jgi:uncharacterized Tic20 family protein
MTNAPPPTNPYQSAPQPLSPSDERLWATLVHVGGIFFSFVPALIGYLVLKDRGPLVRNHTATALNFQLTMLIVSIIGSILTVILVGFLIIAAVGIVVIIFSILAAIAANKGEDYKYPLSIQFIK